MADSRRFKNRFFGHYSAVDCMVSVKFCVRKHVFGNGIDTGVPQIMFFCFLNGVWASVSGSFRIVSDTLVFISL